MMSEIKIEVSIPSIDPYGIVDITSHIKEVDYPFTKILEVILVDGVKIPYSDRPGRFVKGNGFNIDRECWIINNGPNKLDPMNLTLLFDDKPNFTKLNEGMYIVRTQAGFNRAIGDWSDTIDEEPNNWPESYPSLVSFSIGYMGYHFIDVKCVHLNKVKQYIETVDRSK